MIFKFQYNLARYKGRNDNFSFRKVNAIICIKLSEATLDKCDQRRRKGNLKFVNEKLSLQRLKEIYNQNIAGLHENPYLQ